jgi:hypothetical protein
VKEIETTATAARVELTSAEVMLINNALNEVCNGIDIPEFSTRLGATIAEARALLQQMHDLYTTMQTH